MSRWGLIFVVCGLMFSANAQPPALREAKPEGLAAVSAMSGDASVEHDKTTTDSTATTMVLLSPEERLAVKSLLESYLQLYAQREMGRQELSRLAMLLQQETMKRESAFFDPMRSRRIEAMMQQVHTINDEQLAKREQMTELRVRMAGHADTLLFFIRERLETMNQAAAAVPGEPRPVKAVKNGSTHPEPEMEIAALLALEHHLLGVETTPKPQPAAPSRAGNISRRYFDQIANRLNRIMSVLDQFSAAADNPASPAEFLLDMTDVLYDEDSSKEAPKGGDGGIAGK